MEHDRFYFVNVVDANTIKLSNTVDGAIAAGTDIVSLRSATATDTTQSITQGVNLANGAFYSGRHGFGNGDFVYLEVLTIFIGGLNKTDKFFVDPIDNNLFKLATDIDLDNYVTLSNAPTSFANYSWLTHAKVESVAVIPKRAEDVLYVVVNRQINGENKRYIEYLTSYDYGNVQADGHFVDSELTYSEETQPAQYQVYLLEGEKIDATTDGSAHPTQLQGQTEKLHYKMHKK